MAEANVKSAIDADEVATYLREHPGFLARFPELATALELPREEGPATSLASYQVTALRRRNRKLEQRLAELVRVAGENEQLMVRVHAFTLGLLRANDAVEVIRCIAAGMTEDFHTELVRLVLFRRADNAVDSDWLVQVPDGAAALPELAEFLAGDEPLVGRLGADKLAHVFTDVADEVHSAALVRLGDQGLLAVGSPDANRFHPGMGGVFLKLIGEAVTTALERHREA